MFKKFLIILLICLNKNLSAQTINGVVKDNTNQVIAFANVILKDKENNSVAFTTTNDAGTFSISAKQTGVYTIKVSAMDFENFEQVVEILNIASPIKLAITLTAQTTELQEIIVQTQRPITVKKDTIVFNASSFTQGNEEVIEDLLKKIPGLEVDEKGTISYNNIEIEKVMIDGDDMFDRGYKVLTKNMPVNPVDKIELLKNYSNNKHLKGIEHSDKVALNLTLKEDSKRVWFGNINAGYGLASENRYDLKGNLMNFGKKNKFYFLTNLNNTGYNATGDIDHLIRPNRSQNEAGTIGDDQFVNKLLHLNFTQPNFKEQRVNLNNAEMLSLNSIFTLNNKSKIKALVFVNTDEILFYRNNVKNYNQSDLNFLTTENFKGKANQNTAFTKLDYTYDFNQNKSLEITSKYSYTHNLNKSNLLFNSDLLNEKLINKNQLIDQKILFTNKYTNNNVYVISARVISEQTPQNYKVNQFIFQDLFPENSNNVHQFSENKMQFYGVESHWFHKNAKNHVLEIKLGNQLRIDHLNTKLNLFYNQDLASQPQSFQNNTQYKTNDLYLHTKYIFKVKGISLIAKTSINQLHNNLINIESNKIQNPFYITPSLGIDWIINDKNKIISSYNYSISNANVLKVYSGYVLTNFRNFNKGLDQFNQLQTNSFTLNHFYGSWGDKFFVTTLFHYNKNNNYFSSNSFVQPNYTLSESILIKNQEFLNLSTNLDYYFKQIKTNFKFKTSVSKTNFKNQVNGSNLRQVNYQTASYGIELRSAFNGIFNYHLGTKFNHNQVKTSVQKQFTNNTSFLDLNFKFSDRLNLEIQTERYYFGNIQNTEKAYYFLDLQSKYTIKNNKLIAYLNANNLFNTKTFKDNSLTDIYVSQTQYQLMPRYVLLKLEYRF